MTQIIALHSIASLEYPDKIHMKLLSCIPPHRGRESQGLDAKSVVLKTNDNHSEAWDIVLANGKKVQMLASKKNPSVTIKEV
jgi:hypothetical protein